MKVKFKKRYSGQPIEQDFLRLGVQTSSRRVQENAVWLSHVNAPLIGKSFTIKKLTHTDYYGRAESKPTGYATVIVEYFTTLTEGEVKVDRTASPPKALPVVY